MSMDEIRVVMDHLAAFISRCEKPPIIHAAMQRTRSFNTPAPIIGFIYQASGDFGPWVVDGRPWLLPVNHLAFGGAHKGSASPEPQNPVELWAVAFNVGSYPEFDYLWNGTPRGIVPVRYPARLLDAWRQTAARYLEKDTVDPLLLKASILELFGVARSEFAYSADNSAGLPPAIEKACRWMAGNFQDHDMNLQKVAGVAGLSSHHFVRAFSAATGKSPMRYLRDLRIRHSISLLQATDLRVKEIAFSSGFRDPLHFCRIFHDSEGLSPTAFREHHRGVEGQGSLAAKALEPA